MSKIEEAAKAIHYTISGYIQSIGEPPYCLWDEVSADIKQMLLNAVCLIQTKPNITPEEIHDYWCDFARQYMPHHPSLVPFEDLSRTEKIKDRLVIDTVKAVLFY